MNIQVQYATKRQHKGLDQVINSVEILLLKYQISVVFYLLPLQKVLLKAKTSRKFIERYVETNQS